MPQEEDQDDEQLAQDAQVAQDIVTILAKTPAEQLFAFPFELTIHFSCVRGARGSVCRRSGCDRKTGGCTPGLAEVRMGRGQRGGRTDYQDSGTLR